MAQKNKAEQVLTRESWNCQTSLDENIFGGMLPYSLVCVMTEFYNYVTLMMFSA